MLYRVDKCCRFVETFKLNKIMKKITLIVLGVLGIISVIIPLVGVYVFIWTGDWTELMVKISKTCLISFTTIAFLIPFISLNVKNNILTELNK